MASKVYVEIEPTTMLPIRIFKNRKQALKVELTEDGLFQDKIVQQMDRKQAVTYIRLQVVGRAVRDKLIHCEFCGAIVTDQTGHMHEVVSRGDGGEISVDNSRFICYSCHLGQDGEHGDRKWGGRNEN